MDNRKVICAGCQKDFLLTSTITYRKKRCCGSSDCLKIIDKKVTHFNYRKQQKKIANGTFRHGVPLAIKEKIISRDRGICQKCKNTCKQYSGQVHHIIPVSEGGIDHEDNLILLCSDCHTEVHKQGWELFQSDFKKYTNYKYPQWCL